MKYILYLVGLCIFTTMGSAIQLNYTINETDLSFNSTYRHNLTESDYILIDSTNNYINIQDENISDYEWYDFHILLDEHEDAGNYSDLIIWQYYNITNNATNHTNWLNETINISYFILEKELNDSYFIKTDDGRYKIKTKDTKLPYEGEIDVSIHLTDINTTLFISCSGFLQCPLSYEPNSSDFNITVEYTVPKHTTGNYTNTASFVTLQGKTATKFFDFEIEKTRPDPELYNEDDWEECYEEFGNPRIEDFDEFGLKCMNYLQDKVVYQNETIYINNTVYTNETVTVYDLQSMENIIRLSQAVDKAESFNERIDYDKLASKVVEKINIPQNNGQHYDENGNIVINFKEKDNTWKKVLIIMCIFWIFGELVYHYKYDGYRLLITELFAGLKSKVGI